MYTKSFLALNNAGRLAGARTALRSLDEQYIYHHCGSVLVLHAEAELPWVAHTDTALTERDKRSCPCIHPDIDEVLLICSGQLKLATALQFFQYRFSDSFGGNPPLKPCGLSKL